jgi:23S rRNA U2552 (ribose-2'-O)-methylase RlmE/FtsJ
MGAWAGFRMPLKAIGRDIPAGNTLQGIIEKRAMGHLEGIRVHELNLETLRVAKSYLNDSGTFIVKTFQNTLLKNFRTEMENYFSLVQTFKPAASKSKSGEIYLYGDK